MRIPEAYFTVNYTCPHCGAPQKRRVKGLPAGSRLSQASFWCPMCKKGVSISVEFFQDFANAISVWKTPPVG